MKKHEIVDVFLKANLSEDLNPDLIYDILNIYSNLNALDYIKFMTSLLKDIRSKL